MSVKDFDRKEVLVKDFYKKECLPTENCDCVPKKDNRVKCEFSNEFLITDMSIKYRLMQNAGWVPPDNQEANDFLEEFPLFVIKAGTTLCHASKSQDILKIEENKFYIGNPDTMAWWNKYYVGHKSYSGGWFTYKTSNGGPEFGLLLEYIVDRDIPVLFIPNYRVRKDNPEYFPDEKIPWDHGQQASSFTGSHLVQGVKNWKKKGYKPIVPWYYADELAERLVSLGFLGYISCDECEVFITHEIMKTHMNRRPVRIKYKYAKHDDNIYKKIIDILCTNKLKCPLKINEGTRANTIDMRLLTDVDKLMSREEFIRLYREDDRTLSKEDVEYFLENSK
jgi:hypothetical protein